MIPIRALLPTFLAVSMASSTMAGETPMRDQLEFIRQEWARHAKMRDNAGRAPQGSSASQAGVDAVHYDLDLEIDPASEAIAGTLHGRFVTLVPTPLTIDLDLVDVLTVSEVREAGSPVLFTHLQDMLQVSLSNVYSAGDTIDISVDYAGNPTVDNDELGVPAFSFQRRPNAAQALIIFTISEPYSARAWWPCKDDPGDKATVTLHVTVPDTLLVASNGTQQGPPVNVGGGRHRFDWVESYPIATYLVSLAISNYTVYSDYFHHSPTDSMEVTYFVYPEDLADAQKDFALTVPMLEVFSGLFGDYPFLGEKYGMAEIRWGGAMEHQTCTSLGAGFVRGDSADAWVIAHELSHQWWGDLVTPSDWRDIWLNEGFATYSEALWFESQGGVDAYRSWVHAHMLESSFSGSVYDPNSLFGVTVYWKGMWVLHMLRYIMGDAAFFDALRDWAADSRYAYQNGTTADFEAVCEARHGGDLSWFFEQWVYGTGQPEYEFFWAQSPVPDGYVVDATIRQRQSGAVFAMPVEMRFTFATGEATIVRDNVTAVDPFQLKFASEVQAVSFDPDGWILKTLEERYLSPEKTPSALNARLFPNPFNSAFDLMTVEFDTGVVGAVKVTVYDASGAQVRVLMDAVASPQAHEVIWDGTNAAGQSVGAGVYFVQLQTAQATVVRKAVIVK